MRPPIRKAVSLVSTWITEAALADKIQSIKGMHDILNDQSAAWKYLEDTIQGVLNSYGYEEIRTPLLEKTELFKRSIGEATDIVSKEMYTFTDLSGDSLTLRPEGTASVVRSVVQHSLYRNNPLRLWYCGPMFRHERPQKGRMRQFHQIGAEAIGFPGPDIDAELIAMCARFWGSLGIDGLELQLNTLGSAASRAAYRNVLVEYFSDNQESLDEDSIKRLELNPLRILDSKNPAMQELIAAAPAMNDHLDEESAAHFEELKQLLGAAGIDFTINPRLVRGLDYYSHTVFEWVSQELGAQSAVCAGGRYDGLLEHYGAKAVPGIGFAMGLERLIELMRRPADLDQRTAAHVYLVMAGENAEREGFRLAEELRSNIDGLRLVMHCGGGSFKSQFKKADKSGARVALILGEEELAKKCVSLKYLRSEQQQEEVEWSALPEKIRAALEPGQGH